MHVSVPWRPILLIGVALMCVYIADSAVSNWSAVYLTKALQSSESLAAFAYVVYAVATLLTRTIADRATGRAGAVLLVRAGSVVGAVGILIVAVAPTPAVAILGFAVLGIGVAPVIPLAFTAAGSHDPSGTGAAVARVNVFNYAGFVLGAPLVGVIAEVSSLRWGFALLIPVILVAFALAPRFRPAERVEAA